MLAMVDSAAKADRSIADLVGEEAWASLPHAIRARFGAGIVAMDFCGDGVFEATAVGRVFALVGFAFGRPLPRRTGVAQVEVAVRHTANGEVWTRRYQFQRGEETALSTKQIGVGNWLEERAGPLIMRLNVFAEGGALIFECIDFLLRFGPVEIPLPLMITPGRIRVEHHDRGQGYFTFKLEARHPIFGCTFRQVCDVKDTRISQ